MVAGDRVADDVDQLTAEGVERGDDRVLRIVDRAFGHSTTCQVLFVELDDGEGDLLWLAWRDLFPPCAYSS